MKYAAAREELLRMTASYEALASYHPKANHRWPPSSSIIATI